MSDTNGREAHAHEDVRARARRLLNEGDTQALLAHLREKITEFGTADLAAVLARLGESMAMDDLASAGRRAEADPANGQARYDFAYACIERGVPFAAVPVLEGLLRDLPRTPVVYRELVSALEAEERHRDAVEALRRQEPALEEWPDRYLLAYNALLAGDAEAAVEAAGAMSPPEDADWRPAWERLTWMTQRAQVVRGTGGLSARDLRGWHFTLTGGLLQEISPYGYDEGMNGRYAMLFDSYDACARSLTTVARVLAATGHRPVSVGILPDRSSRALGLAAASLLGIPAELFAGPRADQLVVAYDLNEVDRAAWPSLSDRAPGQVLYEHATSWTDPPPLTADISGRLVQHVDPAWAEGMRMGDSGAPERIPADPRPDEALAEEIAWAAAPFPPADAGAIDSPARLIAFAQAVDHTWLKGRRVHMPSSGPVPSGRFA